MKKCVLFLLIVAMPLVSLHAKKTVPAKMLKGIECTTDEFTGAVTYNSKRQSCLSVVEKDSHADMFLKLSIVVFDSPRPIKKMYLLAGDYRATIDDEGKYELVEVPQRYMKTPPSGTFGTASYQGAVFDTRMTYESHFKDDAVDHLDFINSVILNKGGKVKFECEGGEYVVEIDDRQAASMKSLLEIYNYLSSQ